MNDSDLKKLRELIKEEIRPVKEIVEVIKKKVDNQELHIHVTTENVRSLKEQQSVMNEKLDEIKETLEANTASVVTIEKEIKAYGDMYKINNSNGKKLEKRIETLEDKTGIIPVSEFTLAEVS